MNIARKARKRRINLQAYLEKMYGIDNERTLSGVDCLKRLTVASLATNADMETIDVMLEAAGINTDPKQPMLIHFSQIPKKGGR